MRRRPMERHRLVEPEVVRHRLVDEEEVVVHHSPAEDVHHTPVEAEEELRSLVAEVRRILQAAKELHILAEEQHIHIAVEEVERCTLVDIVAVDHRHSPVELVVVRPIAAAAAADGGRTHRRLICHTAAVVVAAGSSWT